MPDGLKDTTASQVGVRLRAAIEQADISQSELARRISVDRTTIARYLAGNLTPRLVTLRRIADVLGCQPGDLVDTDEAVA